MAKPLKIALVSHSFLPQMGGVEVAVHHLGRQLANLGHRIDVVTALRSRRPAPNPSYQVRFYPRTPREIVQGPTQALWLRILQHRYHYDVVHFHMAPLAFYSLRLGLQRQVPLLITTHGGDVQVFPELGCGDRLDPVWDRRIRGALQRADAVTAISRNTHKIYRSMGIPEQRIFDVPNGVDLNRFETRMPDIRPQLGIPSNTHLILAVGRGNPIKDYPSLIHAADLLKQRGMDFRLALVGRQTSHLKADMERRGLGRQVLLVGQTNLSESTPVAPGPLVLPDDRLLAIYQAADLLVSASLQEGLPLVLLEAMGAGLPIVATDVPGNQDLVQPGQNGLLVPAGDPGAMADAIVKVLQSPARHRAMGDAGRDLVQNFGWDRVARQYETIYDQLRRSL